jgi:UDP-glucose 4-epimerase
MLSDMQECIALNLGTGSGYSNQEIVDTVSRLVGEPKVNVGTRRIGDPDRLVAGNLLAKTTLGWRPEHSDLETIINSAWKWYNNPPKHIDK